MKITSFSDSLADYNSEETPVQSLAEINQLVSHELRTPITSIQAALKLLKLEQIGTLSSKSQRLLEIALNNTERLIRLSQILENQPSLPSLAPLEVIEKFRLEKELHQALKQDEFVLFYQPIVCTQNAKIVGFEALIRWQHPRRGWVTPIEFIPLAEETGLIQLIGDWVLRQACQQLEIWQEQFPLDSSLKMSVNLSTLQLSDPQLSLRVQQIVQQTHLNPKSLQLEITETAFLENSPIAIANLQNLKQQGVYLHIDDFGTGYSSLSRLQDWPIDVLKIDNSFVRTGKWNMIQAILMLAQSLNVEVIAEGVETEQDWVQLQQLGCPYLQGYLFSRPVDSQAATLLIAAEQLTCY
ncbi:his Kinase A domain protein [Lyngbya aestuarii BL J]|uniref:histidine kinase n=1 Tax=Lyngbya aestuarii BL J TaxID=1348334 RepID=U7QQ20_9CYAN|nr:EAL domain-containing protein [Lyngbya aestuarii]ERT08501.1 his Kinase A domain protein [Lyngbya aestuarii BL J]